MKLKASWTRTDYFIFFVLVPAILTLIYLLPETIKNSFVLQLSSPNIISVFLSNYVHLDFMHFFSNLVFYLIMVFWIFVLETKRSQFRRVSLLIFVVLPFILSLLMLFIFPVYVPKVESNLGFSGVESALSGYLLYSAYNFLKQNYNPSLNKNFLYLMLVLNLIIAFFFRFHNPIVFVLAVILLYLSLNQRKAIQVITHKMISQFRKSPIGKGICKLIFFLMTIFFLFSLVVLLPLDGVTNIVAHYAGYVFGLGVGLLVDMFEAYEGGSKKPKSLLSR